MGRPNRIFPAWKKSKKSERPPGSHPVKNKKQRIAKPIIAAMLALGLLVTPVAAGTGVASWYGPGNGAAMPFCTWTYRTTHGCGSMLVTSLDTGISVVVPIIDYCQCYVGTAQERIIDLQWGVVTALGLDISRGLYRVQVEPANGIVSEIPDTAMKRTIAHHWMEGIQ